MQMANAEGSCAEGFGLNGCCQIDSGDWPRFRYVQATETLAVGHVVCRARAHAVTVCEEWRRRCCAACFSVAEGRLSTACDECDQCYYCNSGCKSDHALSHSATCPALCKFAGLKKVGKETMAVLRLLLEVLAREHTASPLANASIAGGDAMPDETRGCQTFEALQHHPASYDTTKEATDWSKCCTTFRHIVEQCDWCPWSPRGLAPKDASSCPLAASPPTDAELHALVSRIDSNCFGVFREGQGEATGRARLDASGRNVDLLGRGVYLDACLFNHSCAPNCSVSAGVHTLEVCLDEQVEPGTELTISYCDLLQPHAARQRHLRKAYHFDCACERCTAEAAGDKSQQLKLSYSSGGGSKQPPRSKRERRERREERKAPSTGEGSMLLGESAAAGGPTDIHVSVDLRVLLKLVKAAPLAEEAPARRKGGPGARNRHALQQQGQQRKEPVVCMFLKCRQASVDIA